VTKETRLRRSLLYVPGDREEMLRGAARRGADGLILNLEDAVAETHKEMARAAVVSAIQARGFGACEVIVRVNPLDTAHGYRDLLAVAPAGPNAILLPKVKDPEAVRFAAWTVERLEAIHDLPPGRIRLMCMIESAAGVLAAAEIARAHPRVSALLFGAADYTEDVGCALTEDRRALAAALAGVVLAARAAGIGAIDAPHMRPTDAEGLRTAAFQARELGFDGKSAIHPAQIATINAVFSPSEAEIAWAGRVLTALGAGAGADLLDGELIEAPHVSRARRILAVAEQIGAVAPSEG
jgi:citrate lyase subunit beta/citryl-CoA lyase